MFILTLYYNGRQEIQETFKQRYEAIRKLRALHLIGRKGWTTSIKFVPSQQSTSAPDRNYFTNLTRGGN